MEGQVSFLRSLPALKRATGTHASSCHLPEATAAWHRDSNFYSESTQLFGLVFFLSLETFSQQKLPLWSRCDNQCATQIPWVADSLTTLEEAKLLRCGEAGWEGVLWVTSNVCREFRIQTRSQDLVSFIPHSLPSPSIKRGRPLPL